jgi:hypothetical protein
MHDQRHRSKGHDRERKRSPVARQARLEVKGAGMFDYYEHVFTTDDEKDYRGYIDAYITPGG